MSSVINVGIADLNIALAPDVLATYALGSCVGICLFDSKCRVSGLAHIMLPWSTESARPSENKRRYADTGINELVGMMKARGANCEYLVAKIAGGAQMFATNSSVFNIGERNVQAVKKVLAGYKIPIVAEQTGENFGRTLFFDSNTGLMKVKSATRSDVIL